MTSPNEIPRERKLKAWMVERDITNVALAKELGVSNQRVSVILRRDTMPTELHAKCLQLGFPIELLPEPVTWRRKPRTPMFPGLVEQAET